MTNQMISDRPLVTTGVNASPDGKHLVVWTTIVTLKPIPRVEPPIGTAREEFELEAYLERDGF